MTKISDIIEMPPVKTVIELATVRDSEGEDVDHLTELLETFVVTDDIEQNLRVILDSIASHPGEGMGFFLEVTESGNLYVQSLYEYQSYIVLEGFMDSALEIVELDQNGDVRRTMPFRKNENGVVKFLAHPGYMYKVVSE